MIRLQRLPDLDHIGAYRLVVRGADGELIEEDTSLSERSEGRNKSTAFVVEVPAAAAAAAATTGMFNFNLMDKKKKEDLLAFTIKMKEQNKNPISSPGRVNLNPNRKFKSKSFLIADSAI